jgi:hypothetical protein
MEGQNRALLSGFWPPIVEKEVLSECKMDWDEMMKDSNGFLHQSRSSLFFMVQM